MTQLIDAVATLLWGVILEPLNEGQRIPSWLQCAKLKIKPSCDCSPNDDGLTRSPKLFDCADELQSRNALAIEIRVSYDRDAEVLLKVVLFTMFSCKLVFNLMHALDFTLLAS